MEKEKVLIWKGKQIDKTQYENANLIQIVLDTKDCLFFYNKKNIVCGVAGYTPYTHLIKDEGNYFLVYEAFVDKVKS